MNDAEQQVYDAQCALGALAKQRRLEQLAHYEAKRRAKRGAEPTVAGYARLQAARAKRARRNKTRRHNQMRRIIKTLKARRERMESSSR